MEPPKTLQPEVDVSPRPPVQQLAKRFIFNIGDVVQLVESSETGRVIGRAEFEYSHNSYYIRYLGGDNRQVEEWWTETAIVPPQTT